MNHLLFLVVLAALALPADAQPALFGGAPPPDADDLVTWTGPTGPVAVTPGEAASVRLGVTIADGWHVYALDSPTGLPLRVETELPAGVRLDGLQQSPPIDALDPTLGEPVRWFEGQATVELALLASPTATAGERPATVDVTFGVCDDRICLPPRTQTVEFRLAVAAPPPEASEDTPAAAPLADASASADTTEAEAAQADIVLVPVDVPGDDKSAAASVAVPLVRGGAGEGLAGFLLLAVGAGLAALLTPCVFPLIPLTVGAFSHESTSRGGAVGRALGFGLAVVAVFTALGGAASAALGAAGAQQVAANPWVNLALGAAFVVFALALLGLVELRLPARWATAVDGASRKSGGVAGTLLAALALAVVSFSCTAPFVGGLLATAAGSGTAGGWARPLLGMAAFSAAFATPFVVLAAAPGLAARLPRSGAWMATVKGTLGFVELAAALKFLSNADLVWGVGLLTRPVVVALTMAVALLATAFLLGRLRIGHDAPPASIGAGRLLGATVALAAVLILAPGLAGGAVPLADAYLPPRTASAGDPGASGSSELTWFTDDLDAARAQAAATGTPLFVDFTGYTCTNCRAMEATVFPSPEVAPILAGEVVRARLYTDARPHGPAFQAIQQAMTGTVAMPTYAVVSPGGEVVGVWSGMASPGDFAAFLRSALDRTPQSA